MKTLGHSRGHFRHLLQQEPVLSDHTGLDETLVSVSISRISRSKFLVSVSENHFTEVSVSSRSQKKAYKKFSSRVLCFQGKISRNSSRNSCLVLDFSHFSVKISGLGLRKLFCRSLGLVSILKFQSYLVSSRSRKTWSRLTLDHYFSFCSIYQMSNQVPIEKS